MDSQLFIKPLFSIHPFDWHAIGAGLLSGVFIGLERQLRGKPVGIRTSVLIILGTYVFVHTAQVISVETTDTARIIGQVITGIGFLGAGVMLSRDGIVMGVTSAATIWALAAIGICIGIGHYLTAIKLSLIVVTVLLGVDLMEEYFQSLTMGVHQKFSNWKDKKW